MEVTACWRMKGPTTDSYTNWATPSCSHNTAPHACIAPGVESRALVVSDLLTASPHQASYRVMAGSEGKHGEDLILTQRSEGEEEGEEEQGRRGGEEW